MFPGQHFRHKGDFPFTAGIVAASLRLNFFFPIPTAKMKQTSLFLFATAFCVCVAEATTLFTTDFNSPTYSNGGLIGQDSWVLTSSTANPITVANSATDGTVTLVTSGQDVRRAFTPAQTSGSVYMTVEFTVGSAQATGDYFVHLGDNTTSNFFARTYIRSSGAGFVMALGTSSGTVTYGTTVLNLNTAYTLLARYDFVPGLLNDTGALFINPSNPLGEGDTAYVAATTTGADATTINSVSLRQGTAGNAPGVTIDSITVAIPEPAAGLLGGLGFVALLRRRR